MVIIQYILYDIYYGNNSIYINHIVCKANMWTMCFCYISEKLLIFKELNDFYRSYHWEITELSKKWYQIFTLVILFQWDLCWILFLQACVTGKRRWNIIDHYSLSQSCYELIFPETFSCDLYSLDLTCSQPTWNID